MRRAPDRAHPRAGAASPCWTARCVSSRSMDIVQKMKRDWDRRASHHAKFWIATEDWQTDDAFADSGRRDGGTHPPVDRRELAARMVCARDRMWHRARDARARAIRRRDSRRRRLGRHDPPEPRVAVWRRSRAHAREQRRGSGALRCRVLRLAYAYVAFQHMPRPVFAAYLRDARRVLRRGGLIAFQIYLAGPASWIPTSMTR